MSDWRAQLRCRRLSAAASLEARGRCLRMAAMATDACTASSPSIVSHPSIRRRALLLLTILQRSVLEVTSKAWVGRWSGHKWATHVSQLIDSPTKALPPQVAASLLKELLVSQVLASPLIVSYLAHGVAMRLIGLEAYVAAVSAAISAKTITTANSIQLLQPPAMLLRAYDSKELPQLTLDVYRLVLSGTLQFAETLVLTALPAVSNGVSDARTSASLEAEWRGALHRLSEAQPAVSDSGLPLCVKLLAQFEAPRLIAALLSALATSADKRQQLSTAVADLRSLVERSQQLSSLRRALLLSSTLLGPTLDAINDLAIPPSQPLLLTHNLTSFKLALSAILSSTDLFLFSDIGPIFDRLRSLHSLTPVSFLTHIFSALSSLYSPSDPTRRALFFGVFPALFSRWTNSAESSVLLSAIASLPSSALQTDIMPYLILAQLAPANPSFAAAVTSLQQASAVCEALERQLSGPQNAAQDTLQTLLTHLAGAPHLQRRLAEQLIGHLDSDALRPLLVPLVAEARDTVLPILHVHALLPSLLAALLRAMDAVGAATGAPAAAHSQFSWLAYLCAELFERYRLHEVANTDALARIATSAPSAEREASKRVRNSAGDLAHRWLLSFRRAAPGGERVDQGVVDALFTALTGQAATESVERFTPWQMWVALPFSLPSVLRSPDQGLVAQLPPSFQLITQSATYLTLRTAEWLQAELMTGVDSAGLGPWAPALLQSTASQPIVQLFCAHVAAQYPSVFSPPMMPPPLVPSPDPAALALTRPLAALTERSAFDAASVAAIRTAHTRLGDTAFVLALLEVLFRPPNGLRDELFGCSTATAEAVAWTLHVASSPPPVLLAHLTPLLAELEQQPRGAQLAVFVGTLAALDARYVSPLWNAVLTGLPRAAATAAESFFSPLVTLLLGLGTPSAGIRAAEALRLAGLERFALLAFDWSDPAARTHAAAFFSLLPPEKR